MSTAVCMRGHIFKILIFSVITFVAANISAKEVTAVKATESIIIDGKLSERIWDDALKYNVTGTDTVKTVFGLLYDEDAIYVGIVNYEPDMPGIKAECEVRDGGIWRDDSIEIFLNPEGDLYAYYHIGINALGTIYDAWAYDGGQQFNVDWSLKDIKVAVSKSGNAWTIELKIPLYELGLGLDVKRDSWRFNLVRTRHADGTKYLSFSNLAGGGNHQPHLFSKLNLEVEVDRFRWQIDAPVISNLRKTDAWLESDMTVYIRNQTDRFRFFEIQALLTAPSGKSEKYHINNCLDKNQKQGFSFPVKTHESGKHRIEFAIVDLDSKACLKVVTFPLLLEYNPLNVSLENLYYRQAIFATQQPLNNLDVKVEFRIQEEEFRNGNLKLSLINKCDEILAEKKYPKIIKTVDCYELQIPTLAPGKYLVRATLTSKDKNKFIGKTELEVHPHVANEVRIDENKVLLVNDKPFMPIGFFNVAIQDLELAQKMGVNTTIDYGFQIPVNALKNKLDKYHEYGIMAMGFPYPPDWPATTDANIGLSTMPENIKELMRRRIKAIGEHPALLAWYMLDEPNRSRYVPEFVQDVYELLKSASPFRPAFISHNSLESIELYADIGGDIDCSHPYTLFIEGAGFSQPLTKIADFLDRQEKISEGKRLKWIAPQGFSWQDNGIEGNRPPTFKELRVSAYLAVIHGAKGFIWYIWPSQFSYPEMKIGFPRLIKELKTLQEAIMSPVMLKTISAESPIHVVAKKHDGKTYIFAVNTGDRHLTSKIHMGDNIIPELQVISEERRISVKGNSFSDEFAPYATHIYTDDRLVGNKLASLTDIAKEIAEEKCRIAKPGNLAHHSRGAKVSASPAAVRNMNYLYKHVISGYLSSYGWSPKIGATPYWIEIQLAKVQEIGRIVVYGPGLLDYDLQYMKDGEWLTIKKVKDESAMPSEHLFSPVFTNKIRILVNRIKTQGFNGRHNAHVREVEIYAPENKNNTTGETP